MAPNNCLQVPQKTKMMKIGLTLRNLSNRIVSAFSKRQWRRKWGSYVIQKLSDWEFSQIMKSMSSFNIKILISCECWILRRKTVKLERENKSLCWAYQQNIRNCAESFLCLVLCQSSRKHCMMIQLKVAAPPPASPTPWVQSRDPHSGWGISDSWKSTMKCINFLIRNYSESKL